MTTGAALEIASTGFISRQGSTSSSANFQPMVGSKSVGTDISAQETTPNPASNWRAVLASAGIFAEGIEEEKPAPNLPSASNASGNSSSLKGYPAPAAGSLQPQPSSAARSNSGAMRSVNLTQAHVPGIALPAAAGMPESGAILLDRKTQTKSDPENATHAASALHVNKNEKSESAATPRAAAAIDPAAAAAMPAVVPAPVMLQPATVSAMSAQDQFDSTFFGELANRRTTLSASPHSLAPETPSRQSALNGIGEGKTPDEMKDEQPQSTQTIRSAHFIDASADLAPAQDLPSSTSLKSAAAMQQDSSSSFHTVTRPESLQQSAAIVPGANGAEIQLNAATAVLKAAESREAPAVGSIARQASPLAGRSNEVAIETAHVANQADLSAQEQSFLPIRDTAGVQIAPGATGNGSYAGTSTSTGAAVSGIQETFVSIDGANHAPAATWVHAGARTAEAGYQDPALGWVGVRAQVDINGVHAALVPGSADAAQALGGHLAGLNTYLAEHHAGVETLTMAAPEGRSNEQDQNQRSGQNPEQGSSMGEHSGQSGDSNRNRALDSTATRRIVAAPSEGTVVGSPPGGVYVSVMA